MMLGVVGVQVLMRYAFNSPLIWSEELARFGMIWLTFIAAALATRKGQHIALIGIINPNPRWRLILNVLTSVSVVVVLVVLGVQGWLMVLKTVRQISPALGIQMSWVFASVPTAVVLMIAGQNLRWLINGPDGPAEPEEE